MNFLNSLFHQPIHKIGFDVVKSAILYPPDYYIINTLPPSSQDCLIKNTISYLAEEKLINDLISSYNSTKKIIIIYGLNSQDNSVEIKYKQLVSLGLENVCIYSGGFFEWTLLQDIYGQDQFPTTSRVVDLLRGQNKGFP
jgi:hypothetical protein